MTFVNGASQQRFLGRMKRPSQLALVVSSVIASLSHAEVKHDFTRIGAWIDAGQIVEGTMDYDIPLEMQVLTRSKVALTQTATINDRLVLTGAMGGLFFYSLPVDPGGPHTRLTKFTAVLEEASANYKVGDLDAPVFDTKFGLFFHKYNPDAKNLGEYLFRSGTYPGYLQTGGWYILNNAGYFLQGVRASFHMLDNTLHPEVFLFMERDYEPTYDLTPAFMLTYAPSQVFQAGVGVAFNHLIPAKPSGTTLKFYGNAYRNKDGKDVLLTTDEAESLDTLPGINYYTFKGTKVIGRASINLQALINTDLLNPEDLKLYGEFAILGVKNYPIYYTNIAKRIPIMFGINLPTFKLLDMMSFEVEYYDSDYPNSLEEVYERTSAVPGSIGGVGSAFRQNYVDSLGSHRGMAEKTRWSLWAQKQITPGLGVTFQAASDHFRPMNFNLKPSYEPATQSWSDWYYMFRISFGI